jgi:hypothetical protein
MRAGKGLGDIQDSAAAAIAGPGQRKSPLPQRGSGPAFARKSGRGPALCQFGLESFRQCRDNLENITDYAVVGDMENRGVFILIDGDNVLR